MNRGREALVQRPLVAWVQGAKLAGKVNVSELLINIVRMIVPKLLGTDQKVRGRSFRWAFGMRRH